MPKKPPPEWNEPITLTVLSSLPSRVIVVMVHFPSSGDLSSAAKAAAGNATERASSARAVQRVMGALPGWGGVAGCGGEDAGTISGVMIREMRARGRPPAAVRLSFAWVHPPNPAAGRPPEATWAVTHRTTRWLWASGAGRSS